MDFEDSERPKIQARDKKTILKQKSIEWVTEAARNNYTYNFSCLGRPIIQLPQDMVALQELIWEIKPDLIIETGIAHGGSLVLSASMLAMLDMCEAIETGMTINPKESKRKVLGVDIDIREHNRIQIEGHPMSSRIRMIEGSSIAPDIIAQVHAFASGFERILVCLDSNHTHSHVLSELNAYAPLTSKGSYCCVFDTIVEDIPKDVHYEQLWGPGNNPKTAVWEYLKKNNNFRIDTKIQDKLLLTVAPDGYLKRI